MLGFGLIVIIDSEIDGALTLDLPRASIDAKKVDGTDDTFLVFIDGAEVPLEETTTSPDTRKITIEFEEGDSDIEIIVKKMDMLPIECVVRGYFYGSLVSRWKKGEVQVPKGTTTILAAKLPEPIFDPTTKSEHDIPIDKTKAIEMKLVTEDQYNWLEKTSIDIYKNMADIADNAGFILTLVKKIIPVVSNNKLISRI